MTTLDTSTVVTPANWVIGPPQEEWTDEDYYALPDDGRRYEIVDGVLYMAPSPLGQHQDIVGEIFACLRSLIKVPGLGLVRMAPSDVELNPYTVVQPDIYVVLNEHLSRVTSACVLGAPDLVVEVVSPSSAIYDRNQKYHAYAHAGVPEYWIADPATSSIEVLILDGVKYHSLGVYMGKAELPSKVVPEVEKIAVEEFFK